ncbi:MAG: 2-phospho-L-lactate guanylyltransferase [Methanotrichaceae archaeon]
MQRPVQVVVPFRLENAKSRLAPVLLPDERMQLALAMLQDVLEAVSGVGLVTILSRPGFHELKLGTDVDVVESGLELNDALNSFIERWQGMGWPTDLLIVMADLALLTRDDISGILGTPGDVVLSPGRGGGTNMVLIRNPEFRTCYRGISFTKHLNFAQRLGLQVGTYSSYRAGCDIDEPTDLAEVLIHGRGVALQLLKSLGFVLLDDGQRMCARNQNQDPRISEY